MNEVEKQLYDPLKNRVFGGVFGGYGFEPAGTVSGVYEGTDFMAWKLRSEKAASTHKLKLVLCNSQYLIIKMSVHILVYTQGKTRRQFDKCIWQDTGRQDNTH